MKKEKEISVIICTYNPTNFFRKTIESILDQTIDRASYEVIVVDDGSRIDINEILCSFLEEVQIIKIFPNRGLGYARSEGIKTSKGNYIVFTDDDCIVERNWLEKILEGYKKFKKADGIGGKILPYTEDSLLELYAHRCKNPIYTHIPQIETKDRIRNYLKKFVLGRSSQIRSGQRLDSIMGLNSSYKRDFLVRVCYTDSNLKRGVDWDLNIRLKEIGALLYYSEDVIVYHKHRSTYLSFFKHIFNYAQAYVNISNKHKNIKLIPYPFPIILLFLLIFGLFSSFLSLSWFKSTQVVYSYIITVLFLFFLLYFITSLPNTLFIMKEKRCIMCILVFPILDFSREFVYDLGILRGLFK